jgi:hypothetical protein
MSLRIKKHLIFCTFILCYLNGSCQNRFERINIYTETSFMLPILPKARCDLRIDAPIYFSSKEINFIKEYSKLILELENGNKFTDNDHPFMCYTIIDLLINEEIAYTIYLDEDHNYRLNESIILYKKNQVLWDLIVDTFPYNLGAWR